MKELNGIIEQLSQINLQITEKDNLILLMSPIIELTEQLIGDIAFIQSPSYGDLKTKYVDALQHAFDALKNAKQVSIEPDSSINFKSGEQDKSKPTSNSKRVTFTAKQVTAPLNTDIYQAPKSRPKFVKQKRPDSSEKKSTYMYFTYKTHDYYIDTAITDGHHDIYDSNKVLVGKLERDTVTLISDNSTETIKLKTASKSDKSCLFGSYFLDE